ncbi:MAG: TraR/DksA C4-type zinc finger protein [Desulfobulbus sp.]|nr:TraR/DksA C4-type zinc finger protein [Desulfobulbus sp.]
MSDEADRAGVREEEMRADALAAQARRAAAGRGETSARRCAVCAERIPAERRRALPGVQTCVECQAELERAMAAGRFF